MFIPDRYSFRPCESSPDASVKPLMSSRAAQRHQHLLAPTHNAFRAARTRSFASAPTRWRRLCQSVRRDSRGKAPFHPASCQPQTARFPPRQHCRDCARIRGAVPVRVHPHLPHQHLCCAHRVGRSGPGRGGRLPTARCRSLSGSGSLRSPIPCAAKARHPNAPDRLPGRHSASLRVLGHCQTCRQRPQQGRCGYQPLPPHNRSCLQDCQQPRLPRYARFSFSADLDRHLPPGGRQQGIYIFNKGSGSRRCGSIDGCSLM